MANQLFSFAYLADRSPKLRRCYTAILIIVLLLGPAPSFFHASHASVGFPAHVQSDDVNPIGVPALRQANRPGSRGTGRKTVSSRWYTFTSPDGDFTLEFPGKPSPAEAGEGPVTTIRAYALTTDNGLSFSLNFQDLGGDPRASVNNEWGPEVEELTSAADRRSGVRVVQTHRLAKNIVEAELWQTVAENGANINYLRRSILRRGRVYILACGSAISGRSVDRRICGRFFSSMRFTRNQKDRRRR